MLQTDDLSLRHRAMLGVAASFICMAMPVAAAFLAVKSGTGFFWLLAGGAAFFAALLLAGILWLLFATVTHPLSRLLKAVAAVTRDGRPILALHSSQAWQGMARDLLAVQAEMARLEAQASQKSASNPLAQAMVVALADLAAGKPMQDLQAVTASAEAGLLAEFNAAIAALHAQLGSLANAAKSLELHTDDYISTAGDITRQLESGIGAVSDGSRILSDVDRRFTETSGVARAAAERAQKARLSVEEGHDVARDAVSAMERVKESATGIASVIEGVDKIAFQTRVLAMNAAIEASRAGDAGRGFSVVADLVNALAMRAEEEARSARQQLTATQNDILSAVEAVERMDVALADISGQMDQMDGSLSGIMASKDQMITSEARQAFGTIDRILQQNAILAREMSAAAAKLQDKLTHLFATTGAGPASPVPAPSATGPAGATTTATGVPNPVVKGPFGTGQVAPDKVSTATPALSATKPATGKAPTPAMAQATALAAQPTKPAAAKPVAATAGEAAKSGTKPASAGGAHAKVVPLKPAEKAKAAAPKMPAVQPKSIPVAAAAGAAAALSAGLDDDWNDF